MSSTFHLIDLFTQCQAVEHALTGFDDGEKIAWLSQHGSLVEACSRGTGLLVF